MTPKTISKLKSKCDSDYKSDLIQSDVKVLYEITSGNLFRSLDFEGDGHILKKDIVDALESRGILMSDPRIKDTVKQLSKFKDTQSQSILNSSTTLLYKISHSLNVP